MVSGTEDSIFRTTKLTHSDAIVQLSSNCYILIRKCTICPDKCRVVCADHCNIGVLSIAKLDIAIACLGIGWCYRRSRCGCIRGRSRYMGSDQKQGIGGSGSRRRRRTGGVGDFNEGKGGRVCGNCESRIADRSGYGRVLRGIGYIMTGGDYCRDTGESNDACLSFDSYCEDAAEQPDGSKHGGCGFREGEGEMVDQFLFIIFGRKEKVRFWRYEWIDSGRLTFVQMKEKATRIKLD